MHLTNIHILFQARHYLGHQEYSRKKRKKLKIKKGVVKKKRI